MKYFDVRYYSFSLSNGIYNMQNFIHTNISTEQKPTHNQRYEYYYKLQIIITQTYQIALYILLGLYIGKLLEIILAMTAFATLRHYAGGSHSESRKDCTIHSGLVFITSVYIGQVISISTSIILFIISFILLMLYSPTDHKNNPIINKDTRKRNKNMSIILFFIWGIIAYILPVYYGVITISILLECLSLEKKYTHKSV